jgi:hypothetical protein
MLPESGDEKNATAIKTYCNACGCDVSIKNCMSIVAKLACKNKDEARSHFSTASICAEYAFVLVLRVNRTKVKKKAASTGRYSCFW